MAQTGDDPQMLNRIEEEAAYQQRRQRSDLLSSLMGQYLLRGWCMLDQNCETCHTTLFRTRDGNLYCIYCSEIDVTSNAGGGGAGSGSDLPDSNSISNLNGNSSNNQSDTTDNICRESLTFNGDAPPMQQQQQQNQPIEESRGRTADRAREPNTNNLGAPTLPPVGVQQSHQQRHEAEFERANENAHSNQINSDLVSERISHYLLKGWTMMDRQCEKCQTILFRKSRNDALFCVVCDELTRKQKNKEVPETEKSQSECIESSIKSAREPLIKSSESAIYLSAISELTKCIQTSTNQLRDSKAFQTEIVNFMKLSAETIHALKKLC